MRRALSIPVLLAGALALSAAWRGPIALAALAAAVTIPYALLCLRIPVPATAAVLVLAMGGLAFAAGDPVNAVARLLTAPRPAPSTLELLVPGVILAGLVSACVGVRARRAGTGWLAPAAGAGTLYVAGALLTAGQADEHGVIAVAMVICAAVLWSRRGFLRTAPAVAAACALAAVATIVAPASGAFEPRRLVTPPSITITERSPLPRLAAFAQRGNEELFRYTGPVTSLRLVTLNEFDGAAWYSSGTYRSPGAVAAPTVLPAGPRRASLTAEVTIASLDGLWLPTPGYADSVSLAGAVVDADSGSLALPSGLATRLRYRVSASADLPGNDLAVAAVPQSAGYLTVPRLPYLFAEYARGLVRGASTPFEQAALIEEAVRQGRRFVAGAPPGSSYVRLEEFLWGTESMPGAQVGTSEQFAAAFAVLARAVGLPTRVVVGFRPGDTAGDQQIVLGRHALAWPEVYFTGSGWVAFDPTPSTQETGPMTTELKRQAIERVERSQTQAATLPRPTPPAASTLPSQSTVDRRWDPVPLGGAAGGIVLLLLGVIVVARLVRRLRHRRAGAAGAWSEVLDLMVLLRRTPAPWHTCERIASDVARAVPGPAPHPIHYLAACAERAAFAPPGTTPADLWAQLRRLRRGVPLRRRLLWWANPRPLFQR